MAGQFKLNAFLNQFHVNSPSLEHEEERERVGGEEDDEEGDPVERLALDLLVVLLPKLQLTVRLGQAEEDLGEAEIM